MHCIKLVKRCYYRYRDEWMCKAPESCFGIALKLEDHPEESPDFLQFKRKNNDCRRFLILTLYNQKTGKSNRICFHKYET